MSSKDFKDLKKVFSVAEKVVQNDENLSEWLIDLGASLIHLGVQEK